MIFEIKDKTERKIKLTERQWTHITAPSSLHKDMSSHLEKINETLTKPDKIIEGENNKSKVNY